MEQDEIQGKTKSEVRAEARKKRTKRKKTGMLRQRKAGKRIAK